MDFIDRREELDRLDRLARRTQGGLAVVYGRRRIGKTRLLLEWVARHGGLYTVADQSAPGIQRRYCSEAVASRLPGFSDVEYPDWRRLLGRLAKEAREQRWRGPIVFDEFPYLVSASHDLPTILQRWIDHDAAQARLVVAVAGSSQRMMQGLALAEDAPLYGRAHEILELAAISPRYLSDAFDVAPGPALVEIWAAWGGVPRYWELSADESGGVLARIERLVLDPLGPLHREPDRLLIEEIPAAMEVRPVLDAIGAGAHRVSEIAGRIGRPATSLSRPIDRLIGMGLVRREVPFGEPPRASRKSLYRIDDPFFRLWFRVVAPHRAALASSIARTRTDLLARHWSGLVAEAWEELCRQALPLVPPDRPVGRLGPWQAPARWWSGNQPEWDLVCEDSSSRRLLLGEVRWNVRPLGAAALERELRALAAKPGPQLPEKYAGHAITRALFVPAIAKTPAVPTDLMVITAEDILA
jgi:hypothetical protein